MRLSAKVLLTLIIVSAAACTSTADRITSSTTTTDTPTSVVVPSTTTMPAPSIPAPPLTDPPTGDIDDVALAAIIDVPGYSPVTEPTEEDIELTDSLGAWFPSEITAGIAVALRTDDAGNRIAVFSAIPLSGIRGYPWIADLYGIWVDENLAAAQSATDIIEVHPPTGETFYFWGEGDGVMMTTSNASESAAAYLEARALIDKPNQVWDTGDCIFLPQNQLDYYGNAPWAPVALDIVVPCSGPHNGEILLSEQVGTSLDEFDADQIAYDRSYVCDKAYSETYNRPQGEYLPALITYMPDADEWDRGDRYLACLVVLPTANGSERLVAGPFAEQEDLELDLASGDCTSSHAKLAISCSAGHLYQYVGTVEYNGETFPDLFGSAFDDACASLAVELTDGDDAGAEAFIVGLEMGPYQFELGYRTVNCYAVAIVDGERVEVTGSFLGEWSVVDQDADVA